MHKAWYSGVAAGALWAAAAQAAPVDCEALKAEIEAKIQSQGVANYTLEIVANAEVRDPAMVVGSCANGTRKILYQKNNN
ncbi:DUF1161 domain-containing protein [Pseudomonas sp. NPDC007930]|uniref:DUF1161 domain-containing protein n=1 Tax=Pseudomonas sp. NPDC007930 TaxID=3364417 RepID=UPI0036EF737E